MKQYAIFLKKGAEMEPKGDQGHVTVTWFWHPRAPKMPNTSKDYKRHKKYQKSDPETSKYYEK